MNTGSSAKKHLENIARKVARRKNGK